LLEESENKFRSFIEQSTEGIALIDESGRFVDWNKGMESIFRIDKSDIVNTFAWEFDYRFLPEKRKTPELFEELKKSIIDYLTNLDKTKVLKAEGVFTTLELKQKILSITIFPVITPNRKYVGRLVRDITAIKRAQEEIRIQSEELQEINSNLELQKTELEKTLQELRKTQAQLIQSEKMASLGVLTAGVAHEINNPINYINSALEGLQITLSDFLQIFYKYEEIDLQNVEIMLSEIATLKQNLEFPILKDGIRVLVENMQTGISRITEIVRSLRTFSRIDENDLRLSNIHEIIDTTLVMLHNQYKGRIEIVKNYGDISSVFCYPGKLNQVFMNLFSNAIQAIEAKGEIEIFTTLCANNDMLQIRIKDSGTGIPPEIKGKIFEPFFTTKEAGKGIGLGLSITYGIIKQHNGFIEVKSEVGQGTEFSINIPINLR
jgi:PAS domain S-box-containing protein